MTRILLTAFAVASVLVTMPAFAQMGGGTNSDKMKMDSMTCQQMMDKHMMSMDGMAKSKKRTMMMGEMKMAKKSMAANNEMKCQMHMKRAMGMM